MRSTTCIALLAGSAAAQSTVSLLNFYDVPKTLTQIGSDSVAATYTNQCTGSTAGIPLADNPTASGPASASITPAPRLRYKRQAVASSSTRTREGPPSEGDGEADFCEPYTLKQGASTWSFGFTDPTPGLWTVNVECKWQGEMTNADMTCTALNDGDIYEGEKSIKGVTTTTVLPKAEFSSLGSLAPVAIVTQTGSAAPSQTPSGSAAPATGLAPAGPMPTGAMALVGGAAGVFAAALAL